jgi:LAO/AO transport system kinase
VGLIDAALGGDKRALARLATHIENDDDLAAVAMEQLYVRSGRAHTIGVTGPPGAGKSTLVAVLVAAMRASGRTVAVIAIDPSSALTGGAVLGDRIRMLELQSDPGIFIRSSASRGRSGGLAPSTSALIHLFDAVGYDVVLVETVGIGQEEVEVAHCVDSSVVVQVPGLGDGVQALKAGVLEIADIFVVNKADLPGAEVVSRELRALLTLSPDAGSRTTPVLQVSAKENLGIERLVEELDRHRDWLVESGALARRRHEIARFEISLQLTRLLDRRLADQSRASDITAIVDRVAERVQSPKTAAARIFDAWSTDR